MSKFVSGDEAAFEELYRRAAPKLMASLARQTADRARAEDIVQTTFLKVHRARDRYIPGAAVLPWLHVIAKRSLYDEQRPLNMRLEVLSRDGSLSEADTVAIAGDAENATLLREVFTHLPPQYRDAIELTKLSGLSGNEAAALLHTTKAAIKQRVHRGYELLRAWLEPSFDSELATSG
ncbi:MAG: hypothetical protein RJA70_4693 [Pseudomonadota bacterium]